MFTYPVVFYHHGDSSSWAPIILAIFLGGFFVLAVINRFVARKGADTAQESVDTAQIRDEWVPYIHTDVVVRKAKQPSINAVVAAAFKPDQVLSVRTLTLENGKSEPRFFPREDLDEKTRKMLLDLAISSRNGDKKALVERFIGVGNREFKLKDNAMIAELPINDDITLEFFDGAGVSKVKIVHKLLEKADDPLPKALADVIVSIYIPETSGIQLLEVTW